MTVPKAGKKPPPPPTPLPPAGGGGPVQGTHPTPAARTHDVFGVAARHNPPPPTPGTTPLDDLVDHAQGPLFVKVDNIQDTDLVNRLVAAAQRGVRVEAYLAEDAPMDGAAVLAVQGLEAAGVDIMVDRGDHVAGGVAVADGQALLTQLGGPLISSKDPAAVKTLTDAFQAAMAEQVLPAGSLHLLPEQVRLFPMPDSGAAKIAAAINGAKGSIDLEVYELQDREIIEALKAAAQPPRNVKVRVMLEPKVVGQGNYAQVKAELESAGIQVQPTPTAFDSHHNVDHAKFMVIDGSELLFGSGNLVRSGLGGDVAGEVENRDFWVADTRQLSATEGLALFNADWAGQDTTKLVFKNLVLTPDNADQRIRDLIAGAVSGQPVYVYNQELSDPNIIAGLIAAKKKGADVHVLLGFQPGFGGAPPKNQAALDQLNAAGVPAAFFTGHYLHGKAVLVGPLAFIGSQNFTAGGLQNNRELGETLDDPTAVSQLKAMFESDAAHPTP